MNGKQLRYIRKACYLSQVSLAELLGMEVTAIARFENERQSPQLRTQRKLQQVLKYDEIDLIEISELLADENSDPRRHARLKKKLREQANI